MRPRPRLAAHHWYRLAALALTIGLACEGAGAQRGNAGAAQGGPAVRGGGPPRDPGQGPFGGRGFGRGRNQPTGTAVIRGRVTALDTGAPVRRAQVSAAAADAGFPRSATTDAEGWFEFRDLPTAAWTLTASKPGYVAQRLGQRRAFESVAPIQVANGQQVTDANFALAKGGAIIGRIFDDLGDPLANARVQALRSRTIEGRRRLTPAGVEDMTDDTGAFRLYGLAPGDYYVSASTGFVGAVGGVAMSTFSAFTVAGGATEAIQLRGGGAAAPTYFPGTANAAEAQRIRLGTSEETTIAFGLLAIRAGSISGTVLSADGGQPAGGAVTLRSTDGDDLFLGVGMGGPILAEGAFSIPSVVPGSYVLTARSGGMRGPAGRNGGEIEMGTVNVTVNGEDVSGVTIVMTRGATVEGSVVAAGGSRPTLNGVRVVSRPARGLGGPMAGAAGAAQVTAAGTFQLASMHGAVRLSVEGLPAGWMVQSIEVGGVDVTDSGLELKGTEQITGARVTLTNRIAELNGTVAQGGQWAKDFSVLVFADDETRWTFPGRFVRSTRGNAQGNFSVRGLPPGVGYLAAAVNYLEDGEAEDPEFLASLRERATSVSLREGEAKTIELRVIER